MMTLGMRLLKCSLSSNRKTGLRSISSTLKVLFPQDFLGMVTLVSIMTND